MKASVAPGEQPVAVWLFRQKLMAVLELTKPRALVMIIFTTVISYLIAATQTVDPLHLFHTAMGVTLAAGGALALNQHMESGLDERMERTRTRPIPSGRIQPKEALVIGLILMLTGYLYLWLLVNPACSLATIACGVSYLYMYTPMKTRSSLSSFVGAIPGGLLPIMGWLAVRDQLEIGSWILFVILFLWQIPHALIISSRHREDYQRAGMKQLPLIASEGTSRKQIMLNILVMIPVSLMPSFLGLAGLLYGLVALLLGFLLFVLMIRYVLTGRDTHAKHAFISLSAYLPLLLLTMYWDKLM